MVAQVCVRCFTELLGTARPGAHAVWRSVAMHQCRGCRCHVDRKAPE